jgi:hypothetical protein
MFVAYLLANVVSFLATVLQEGSISNPYVRTVGNRGHSSLKDCHSCLNVLVAFLSFSILLPVTVAERELRKESVESGADVSDVVLQPKASS